LNSEEENIKVGHEGMNAMLEACVKKAEANSK
jgi:hypothetical protein